MMTKPTRLILCCAAAVLTTAVPCSCAQEEGLTPDFNNPSANFAPSTDDMSDEAQLRRQFYTQTGCYLLFSDTLQHKLLGTDINGQPRYFTETVDLTYTVGQSSSTTMSYTFTYLQQYAQKQQVTDFLTHYVLPHLTKGLKPYSWMVCNMINSYKDTYSGTVSHPYAASRAMPAMNAISGHSMAQTCKAKPHASPATSMPAARSRRLGSERRMDGVSSSSCGQVRDRRSLRRRGCR